MGVGDTLPKSCSGKLRKIHRKTSVTESLFNQNVGQQPASYLKRNSGTDVFL